MSDRWCERWAIGTTWQQRLWDWIRARHARHVCVIARPGFMLNHPGDHRCSCGHSWPVEPEEVVRVDDWHASHKPTNSSKGTP